MENIRIYTVYIVILWSCDNESTISTTTQQTPSADQGREDVVWKLSMFASMYFYIESWNLKLPYEACTQWYVYRPYVCIFKPLVKSQICFLNEIEKLLFSWFYFSVNFVLKRRKDYKKWSWITEKICFFVCMFVLSPGCGTEYRLSCTKGIAITTPGSRVGLCSSSALKLPEEALRWKRRGVKLYFPGSDGRYFFTVSLKFTGLKEMSSCDQ